MHTELLTGGGAGAARPVIIMWSVRTRSGKGLGSMHTRQEGLVPDSI